MTRYAFPSPELPPLPAFEMEVPDGWRADEAPQTVAVFFDPDSPPNFTVNLVVSVDRVGAAATLEEAARETLQQSEELPLFQLEQERVVEVDGAPASLRFQTFEPGAAGVGRLMQMQLLFFSPRNGGATRDLVQINATCPLDEGERYTQQFVDMAKSFTFRR